MRTWPLIAGLFLAAATVTGCGPAIQEKTFQIANSTALEHAKIILQNYAQGATMSSEASNFPWIVEEVKKNDPQKADILEKGFADLQKTKGSLAPKAREMLQKL